MLGSIYMVWEYASQAGSVVASIAQHFQSFARQHADYTAAQLSRTSLRRTAVNARTSIAGSGSSFNTSPSITAASRRESITR